MICAVGVLANGLAFGYRQTFGNAVTRCNVMRIVTYVTSGSVMQNSLSSKVPDLRGCLRETGFRISLLVCERALKATPLGVLAT